MAVLEALAGCEALSVSEITRRVKALRGSASRTTIRSRLAALVEAGVVERLGNGVTARYRLRSCGKD
ncbi:helix-turn-helix domain-containing protein [Hyperthermus butylicus]|uniref:helix-turn-helix domain-containing protein n=1 Tax=Hyperthermus butylicus TaxID=54248 RepID=UPI00032497A1|nr:helix-turn-helix domain-containing protein [Hyperthermus butylicus]